MDIGIGKAEGILANQGEEQRRWREKGRKVKGEERVVRRTEEGSGSKGEWQKMREGGGKKKVAVR